MKYLFTFLAILILSSCSPTIVTSSETPPETIDPVEGEIVDDAPVNEIKEIVKNDPSATYSEKELTVGNRSIVVAKYQKGSGPTFINLHDDENTSVIAAAAVIDSLGGTLLQLRHSGKRNVEFRLDGKPFEFDPNRMFTDLGATNTLNRFGGSIRSAHTEVRQFADEVVKEVNADIIFTLHNNSEDRYSAKSYLDQYKNDAAAVHINPNRDPDDFYFVTEPLFYDALKIRGYNVVLQNNKTATDDGSLSVLAAKRKIPYINIEAQHGHLAEQIDMLLTIYELFL